MIDYGFESPSWMAKTIIAQSDGRQVKIAVIQLIQHLESATGVTSTAEAIDILVQVSAVGSYTPRSQVEDVMRDALSKADEILDNSVNEEVRKFREELDKEFPDPEDEDGDY